MAGKETDSTGAKTESKETESSSESVQLCTTEEHDNWLSANEILRLVQKPISIYVDEIISALHEKLRKKLNSVGQCTPEHCNKKTDLCKSCKSWYEEIAAHKNSKNPRWHNNCNSAAWSEDHWEVAKCFMSDHGSNLHSTVKDANSTDIGSLLNVLEWLKDEAFPGETRVNVDLVRKLRSEVRNSLSHDPKQEIEKAKMEQCFSNAIKFFQDLERVWPKHAETEKCLKRLGELRDNGVTIVDKKITTRIPDRLENFIGRESVIERVITLLVDEEKAVVSLHGGPGFGKTTIANEVSHRLSKNHNITVVFSFLTTVTSVDEMIKQLCRDVGANPENDPESSLNVRLKHIKSKVIFVMDNIDNLLDDKSKSAFYKFVRDLRKNSNQNCQILTTSRISYKIPELETADVKVEEMGDAECMNLLRKQCSQQNDVFLRKLAELCGKIPLAMCIASSRVDDSELLHHLQKQPMKFLKCTESDQFVYRAINMSYEKCSEDEKVTLIRLAVFDGSFNVTAAKAVIEKEVLDTKDVLKNLFSQSLIKQPTKHRYSIHLLIKHFLVEERKGENEIAKRAQAQAQAMRAELLMVKHYLELGHELTIKSCSKDGYKESREALKQEVHNIQNVLKICCQKNDPTTSDILAKSEIYTTSATHFAQFVKNILAESIFDEFLQRCANVAEERKQHAIKINFDCLLAKRERIKSKPDMVHLHAMMEKIKAEFKTHEEDFKKDKSLCAHYYYQYGRYLSRKAELTEVKNERPKLQVDAREQLKQSLRLREELAETPMAIADKVQSLLQLGTICKKTKSQNLLKDAQKYYNQAIKLSEEKLGEHERTSSCHKNLGDLFLEMEKFKDAEEEYTNTRKMRENLGLDPNVYASLAIVYDSAGKTSDAVYYAEKALAIEGKIHPKDLQKLKKVVSKK